MTMTLEQALDFQMRDGRRLGDCSGVDIPSFNWPAATILPGSLFVEALVVITSRIVSGGLDPQELLKTATLEQIVELARKGD